VVCAITAHLWRLGLTTTVGVEDEGLMVIPSNAARAALAAPSPLRQAAEKRSAYEVDL
jgi:hypothetical protein